MKRYVKTISRLSIFIFLVLITCTSYIGKNQKNIDAVFEQFFKEYMTAEPELCTYFGDLSKYGVKPQNDRFSDRSDEAMAKKSGLAYKYSGILRNYNPMDFTPKQKLSSEILAWCLQDEIRLEKYRYNTYVVNPMTGIQVQLTDTLVNLHQIDDKKSAKDYITRLSKVKEVFGQVTASSKECEEKGLIPPESIIQSTLEQCQNFIQSSPEHNILYTSFMDKLNLLKNISDGEKAELSRNALMEVKNIVYPAYESFISYLNELKPKSTIKTGVWALPDGEAYYTSLIKHYTTLDITPEEIHQLGKNEVDRISKEINEFIKANPNIVTASVNAQYTTISGSKTIIEAHEKIITDMEKKLPELFDLLPKASVSVKPIPAFREKTSSSSYIRPALDGSRLGILLVKSNTPAYLQQIARLSYHETVPGHHFQIQIANESPNIPLFQKVLPFTGYTEGWATYAEKVAGELGAYNDPLYQLAYLQYELTIARNMMLDTGINYKRWSLEEAAAYCNKTTGTSDYNNTINRCLALPGQYCSYKIGQLVISELRRQAESKLEDKFNIKEFHNIVLKNGAMPLEILKNEISSYITSKMSNRS